MGMFPKFPRKVWLSIFPVTLVMALVVCFTLKVSPLLYYISPVRLPLWYDVLLLLGVYSAMFGPYIVWLTTQGIEYRQSLE